MPNRRLVRAHPCFLRERIRGLRGVLRYPMTTRDHHVSPADHSPDAEIRRVGKQPLCSLLRPRLTSVHVEAGSRAHTAAETLHAMVQGIRPELESLPPTQSWIVEREST